MQEEYGNDVEVDDAVQGTGSEIDETAALEGVLEVARSIRPFLHDLVGPAADTLETQISDLLNCNSPESAAALRTLLASNQTTADFMDEVLADAPMFRPPALQLYDTLRGSGSGYMPLPGSPAPVHAPKFACPSGDYVWYRSGVGTPIPACPTHSTTLVPA